MIEYSLYFLVHECLFCPQTFGSAAEKDDHILGHFAQETCADCNQNLIQIGGKLYTIHNAVTCIKVDSKSHVFIELESNQQVIINEHIPPENASDSSSDESTYTFHDTISIEETVSRIKLEPDEDITIESVNIHNQELKIEPLNIESTRKKNFFGKNQQTSNVKKTKKTLKRKETNTNSKAAKKKSQEKTSDNEENFVCDVCGKVLSSKYAMQRHKIVVHKTEGEHFCNVCIKLFPTADDLAEHKSKCVRKRGKLESSVRFECDICGAILKNRAVLNKHMRWKHIPSAKKFQCKLCKAAFVQQLLLEIHHNRTHLDIKEFMCSYCGRSFKTKDQLKCHTYSHTGEKPFECSFEGCTKSFRTRSNRETHFRTHSGEKPLKCLVEGCGRKFNYVIDLRRHKYRSHGIFVKKYPCPICNEMFPENSFLKSHMLKHHK